METCAAFHTKMGARSLHAAEPVALEALEARLLLSSYPAIPDNFLAVGNRWDYAAHVSVMDYSSVDMDTTMTWEVTKTETVSGYPTKRLEQTTGLGYYDNVNVYLSSDHLVVVRENSTIDDELLTVVNSNPLETFPRMVEDTYNNTYVGTGDFRGRAISYADTWFETDTSYVTYLGQENLDLMVNGSSQTFNCVKVGLRTDWEDDWGESGYDERTFWFDPDVGVVKAHVMAHEYGTEFEYDLTLASYSLAFVDLTGEFPSPHLIPLSVVSGDVTKIKLPLMVRNEGNVSVANGQKIDIDVVARPVGGGDDEPVASILNQSISGLRPGAAKKLDLNVTLPPNVPDGEYRLVAQIDAPTPGQVAEKFEDNNEAIGPRIGWDDPYWDLTGEIGPKLKMPHFVVSGDGTKIKLPVEVRNEGNVPIAKGQKIDIDVVARPVGDGDDVEVDAFSDQSISNLKPSAVKKLNLNVTLPPGVPDGEYWLVAQIDAPTPGRVPEKNDDNNEAVTPRSIDVAEGYVDLIAAIGDKARLPLAVVSGGGTKVKLPIELTNIGNVRLDKAQKIDVGIYARPDGAPDDGSADRFLTAVTGQPVPNLKPMAVKKLNAQVVLNEPLEGDCLLVAYADDPNPSSGFGSGPGQVVEKDEDNNRAVTAATIEFAEGYVDLTGTVSPKAKLSPLLVAGDGTKITLPVEIRNEGNIPIARGQKMDTGLYARPVDAQGDPTGEDDIPMEPPVLTGWSISNLKPGASKRLNARATLPATLPEGRYRLVAQIDSPTPGQVDEKYEDNNEAVSQAIEVAEAPPSEVEGTRWFFPHTRISASIQGVGSGSDWGTIDLILGPYDSPSSPAVAADRFWVMDDEYSVFTGQYAANEKGKLTVTPERPQFDNWLKDYIGRELEYEFFDVSDLTVSITSLTVTGTAKPGKSITLKVQVKFLISVTLNGTSYTDKMGSYTESGTGKPI